MKKEFKNLTHIEGYLYEADLEAKVTGPNSKNPGTNYIKGSISIATDEDCLNIVDVHYVYSTPTTSKGNPNATYGVLEKILNGEYKTVMNSSKEEALKLSINSALGLNEFYTDRQTDENGDPILVSSMWNINGFINIVNQFRPNEADRSRFETDILITNVTRKEADEERELPEKMIVKGYIFNYANEILPISFVTTNPNAMDYFEGFDISSNNPMFTKVWGQQISTTVMRKRVQENAFGEPYVQEIPSTRKEMLITGANVEPHIFDIEETLTKAELTTMLQNRETYLATRKGEYIAAKQNGNGSASQTNAFEKPVTSTNFTAPTGEFKF